MRSMIDDLPEPDEGWFFTSKWSGNDPSKTDCVQVAFAPDGSGAFLRDSKAPEDGYFRVKRSAWNGLLAVVNGTDEK